MEKEHTGRNVSHEKSWLALGTVVRMQVVTSTENRAVDQALVHAMDAIHAVEKACSRFDDDSELSMLMASPIGTPVNVGPILYQSLRFAIEIAQWTDGRFDPTIGARMEELGFRRHYLTGESVGVNIPVASDATFRDIELDEDAQTVVLHKPMKLDLGAVAKGLAVDLAVQSLRQFDFAGFVVDAGGDIYVAGENVEGEPWTVGIRHPILHEDMILTLKLTDAAVCTSGTYERPSPTVAGEHHILDAHRGHSAKGLLSGTAIGPYTMMADGLSTAAFLYPVDEALSLLTEAGLEGVMVTEDLVCKMTQGMERFLA